MAVLNMETIVYRTICPSCGTPRFFSPGLVPYRTACANHGFQRTDAIYHLPLERIVPPCTTVYSTDEAQSFILTLADPVDEAIKERRREQGRAHSLESLIQLGKQRGYLLPHLWAKRVMAARSKNQTRTMDVMGGAE